MSNLRLDRLYIPENGNSPIAYERADTLRPHLLSVETAINMLEHARDGGMVEKKSRIKLSYKGKEWTRRYVFRQENDCAIFLSKDVQDDLVARRTRPLTQEDRDFSVLQRRRVGRLLLSR